MVIRRRTLKTPLCIVLLAVFSLCTPHPMYQATHAKKRVAPLKKNPRREPVVSRSSPVKGDSAEEVKPAAAPVRDAMPSGEATNAKINRLAPDASISSGETTPVSAMHFIRIALGQNVKRAIFLSAGRIEVRSGTSQRPMTKGAISLEMITSSGKNIAAVSNGKRREFSLPCTLWSDNEFNIIRYGEKGYRGSMMLAPEGNGTFSVINYCDVEDYLRGVVPLEIGNCGAPDIEAVKAQAVAARTYTYKKIQGCGDRLFDLLPDISDQVYGGAGAEKKLCNQAINDTRDLVIVYPGSKENGAPNDSLIFAYYHSTCGGRTANVEDVWDKPKLPYLRSIDDCDANGRPYCADSWSCIWEDSWPVERLSTIVNRYSKETFPQNPASGELKNITVGARSSCGRIKSCTIVTTDGAFTYGGDKVRFVLRRNVNGFPILRSALITHVSKTSGIITVKGKGFGHGIGMCQFGAIGRARAGQSYEQILKAYYTGVEIKKIEGRD